jgi:uncharacterized repeat protein (TIGR01451 family)
MVAGALASIYACSDSSVIEPNRSLSPTIASFAKDKAPNGPGRCLAADAYLANLALKGTVSGVSDSLALADPNQSCTSNDISIAETEIQSYRIGENDTDHPWTGQRVTCNKDDVIHVTLAAHVKENASSVRTAIGIWIANNGGNARTGTCDHYNLVAPPFIPFGAKGQPTQPNTVGGVSNYDNDACGDMNLQNETDKIPLGEITAQCNSAGTTDSVHVGSCLAWTVPGDKRVCPLNGVEDPDHFRWGTTPGEKSKCNCGGFNIPIFVVKPPALTLTKKADAASVDAGSQIGFTVTVGNTGEGAATNLTVTDALPAGDGVTWSIATPVAGWTLTGSPPTQTLTYTNASFAPGASSSVHVISGTTAASCKKYDNTAKVTADNGTAPDASDAVTVNCADVKIVKTADAASVSAGDPIGFKLTVTNSGAGTATGVSVTDVLPTTPGLNWTVDAANTTAPNCNIASGKLTCTIGSMAPTGATSSYVVHLTSPTTSESCATINNTGTVTSSNDGGGESSASVTVNCAKIEIEKKADATSVSAGDPIGFTLTVKNSGAGTATGVSLTDVLPTTAGLSWSVDSDPTNTCSIVSGKLTCTIGSLAAGASVAVHITSPTTTASCSTINNKGTVTSSNDGGGESSASVTVDCPATGLIAPTQTTCEQFAAGTAPAEPLLSAGLKGSTINNVSPGVIFYFATVTVPAGGTVVVQQSDTRADGKSPPFPLLEVASGQAYVKSYNTSTKQCSIVGTFSQSSPQAAPTITIANAGTYIVQIKYAPNSLAGYSIPNPPVNAAFPVKYVWGSQVNGGATQGVGSINLLKK